MVDCSECEWKQDSNSISCKKNDSNLGWVNCDYSCTPFQGPEFNENYLNQTFVNSFFCNGPDSSESCNRRNRELKNNYNTNDDICEFSNNTCKIKNDIQLSNLYPQINERIQSLTNQEIYNSNILTQSGDLKLISESNNINLVNSGVQESSCTTQDLFEQNQCNGLDLTNCEQMEGCIYDFNIGSSEDGVCSSRRLVLPNIDFSRYYNNLYSENNDNFRFSLIYNRYITLNDINNWPCIDFNSNYPINCSNNSSFQNMFIRNYYTDINNQRIDINISNQQLLMDQNMLIELINERCFSNTGEPYCNNISIEANLNNVEVYAQIIRNNTISIFSELSSYTLEKIPYILALEFQLFLENPDNNISELFEQEIDIRDINNTRLYPDNFNFFIENLENNEELRNCFDNMLYTGPNDNELFDYILVNPLSIWNQSHFDFIKNKIDKFIEIGPHSINGCLRMINNVNESICRGEITTGIISVITLITEVVGIQINLDEIDQNDPNLQSLIDVVFPRIPEIVKKITDLSTYYELNNCGGSINGNTKVLLEFYSKLLQPDLPVVNYNLFNNNAGRFFDDFINGNIYKKIILLIFIYFIFTRIASILQKK
tara:strand:+ start:881 stop:2683 length:1803 start_codon:yes stop_codon:yes gene_type:complete